MQHSKKEKIKCGLNKVHLLQEMVQCFGWLGRCGLVLEEFCEPNVMLVYMINYSFSLFFTNVGFYVCKLPQYKRFGLSDSLLCYMTTVFFFFPMFTSFVLVDNMSPPQDKLIDLHMSKLLDNLTSPASYESFLVALNLQLYRQNKKKKKEKNLSALFSFGYNSRDIMWKKKLKSVK